MKGTTVIMIAQRIASVKEADRIAVIDKGSIVACDTHENLLKTSDTYREIYLSQMKSGAYAEGGAAI
jgi:ATP-binding cassette subfamily B protein